MGIFIGVGWTYTEKGSYFLQGSVVASSQVCAITSFIWQRTGFLFLYPRIVLQRACLASPTQLRVVQIASLLPYHSSFWEPPQ